MVLMDMRAFHFSYLDLKKKPGNFTALGFLFSIVQCT
jgi:hypothetical protein